MHVRVVPRRSASVKRPGASDCCDCLSAGGDADDGRTDKPRRRTPTEARLDAALTLRAACARMRVCIYAFTFIYMTRSRRRRDGRAVQIRRRCSGGLGVSHGVRYAVQTGRKLERKMAVLFRPINERKRKLKQFSAENGNVMSFWERRKRNEIRKALTRDRTDNFSTNSTLAMFK